MAVDSNDSGQDSGHLVNPFMRVTKYMRRRLATLRVSLELPLFARACIQSTSRNLPLEAIEMLCFSMNNGIAVVRSSSELIVQCTGKASKNISCPSVVTKREYIRTVKRQAASEQLKS